ncbi:MAG: ester cyclase [Pseudonocardia sp.]|nr:ester cyclase [Pseudonocardia sp.]
MTTTHPHDAVELTAVWDQHCYAEFVLRDADAALATMVDQPSVWCLPVGTGGAGRAAVRRFYAEEFIPSIPTDIDAETISRTIGGDRLVEEAIASFVHDREMPWFLPGVAATGRRLEIPTITVITFAGAKIAGERLWWDHAAVLDQLGLLPPGVRASGAARAASLLRGAAGVTADE